jgi:hypothetical protein
MGDRGWIPHLGVPLSPPYKWEDIQREDFELLLLLVLNLSDSQLGSRTNFVNDEPELMQKGGISTTDELLPDSQEKL